MSTFGSQQQFLTRSSTPANVEDGDCNMILGAPGSHCGEEIKLCIRPYVTVDETTESAEKPNIENEHQGLNSLRVPLVQFQSRDHIHEFKSRNALRVLTSDGARVEYRLASCGGTCQGYEPETLALFLHECGEMFVKNSFLH